jgi:hypothetical protein
MPLSETQELPRAYHRPKSQTRRRPTRRRSQAPSPNRSRSKDLRSLARLLTSRRDDPLSSREAVFRFLGVSLLVLIAYLHLMDISHKVQEGVWYMVFLFLTLIVLSLALAVSLVRTDSSSVRFAWVGAAVIALGAMFGFCTSRAIPLPGMADHHGDWFNTLGVFAGLFEAGLVVLAGYALRDRVKRQARLHRRRRARVAAPAVAALGLLMLQPALAFAHPGEEMSEDEMMQTEMGHDMSAMEGMSHEAMGHEPLLGTTELAIALTLALAFVAWAAFALRSRVVAPRTGGRRSALRRGASTWRAQRRVIGS